MGFGVTELLIILAIVLVLFGAKKLRNIGGDLGGAIKNFKTAMKDEENTTTTTETENSEKKQQAQLDKDSGTTIEGTVEHKTKDQV
ncbi:MAG: Sec-independent protein translocase subunit TatA [gamma proteobacterium symbiont of Bathyaustriella thionipta]|nr:Sec-independent protein translocase subunit TatA [gamma proteobacterium symbiont of Bathyaustriella thionipta]MCU7949779.1 Sec-independent protein translocase subunit TatA [gamma proteobacterium symbiont of Bathyaustriella thionipta]MCU7951993.1 Sec-independent protein translocase subunit TatA [gamma proteobacterium symbiont of Bathyaustriella thionipta]MCU7956366.1 Sec-independent protein translocase subunit TatA [gamma proteobacterium symbiont of Bathyaustriella thionipta]MCU7968719.1 Sec-